MGGILAGIHKVKPEMQLEIGREHQKGLLKALK
jgi:hypothetical protein